MQYRQPLPISLWAVCFPFLNNLLLKLCVSAELFPARRQEWRTYHAVISRYVVWEMGCWNGKFLSDTQSRWWQFNRNCPKGDWMDGISVLRQVCGKVHFTCLLPLLTVYSIQYQVSGGIGEAMTGMFGESLVWCLWLLGEVLDPLSVFLHGIL